MRGSHLHAHVQLSVPEHGVLCIALVVGRGVDVEREERLLGVVLAAALARRVPDVGVLGDPVAPGAGGGVGVLAGDQPLGGAQPGSPRFLMRHGPPREEHERHL